MTSLKHVMIKQKKKIPAKETIPKETRLNLIKKQEEDAIDKHNKESTLKKHAQELLGWLVSKTAICWLEEIIKPKVAQEVLAKMNLKQCK